MPEVVPRFESLNLLRGSSQRGGGGRCCQREGGGKGRGEEEYAGRRIGTLTRSSRRHSCGAQRRRRRYRMTTSCRCEGIVQRLHVGVRDGAQQPRLLRGLLWVLVLARAVRNRVGPGANGTVVGPGATLKGVNARSVSLFFYVYAFAIYI
jgi:hypothetical protein